MANKTEQALKLIRDALEDSNELLRSIGGEGVEQALAQVSDNYNAIEALTAASAEAATPVRWLVEWTERFGEKQSLIYETAAKAEGFVKFNGSGKVTPLYAAPQASQPIGQPVNGAMTDEEIKECIDTIDFSQMVTADDVFYLVARAIEKHILSQASQPIGQPLPMAIGVSRDMESPGAKSVLVAFERQLTDDELRTLHSSLSNSQPVSGAVMTDEQIRKIACSMPQQPWGIGSRFQDVVEFARALLSVSGQAVSEKALITACLRACNSVDPQYNPDRANAITECMAAIRALASTPAQQTETIYKGNGEFPEGYCTDPNGVICAPAGKYGDFSFGYDVGYADGLQAIKTSIDEIKKQVRTEAPVNVPSGWIEQCMSAAHEWAQAAYCKAIGKSGPDIDASKKKLREMLAAAPAPVQTEAQQSEKDAERYRWLRDKASSQEVERLWWMDSVEEMEAALDSAIANEKANQKGGAA